MTGYGGIRAFKAPPVSLADTVDTETTCITEREGVACRVDNSDSKTSVAYSNAHKLPCRDCNNHQERELIVVNESRDEQATSAHSDNEQRNSQNESVDTILNMLDKRVTPASHQEGEISSETRQLSMETATAKFNLRSAIAEFLRAYSCGTRFESDDESASFYSKSMDSVTSSRRCHDKSPEDKQCVDTASAIYENQDKVRRGYEENAKDEDTLESMVRILHRELDASREAVSVLETQLSSTFPSPTQIAQLVNHRRQIESLAAEKWLLEAQLKSTQQQLVDAKEEAKNSVTAMQQLQDNNKKLEEALRELKSSERTLKQRLAEVDSTVRSQRDQSQVRFKEKLDLENKTIQQLQLDSNEEKNVVKRLEKDELYGRKGYRRLMEGEANNKVDLELRIEREMEKNLEIRRKCYVLEQKLNDKKKFVRNLEFELNRMKDEVLFKNRECESLVSQIDHLKRAFCDGERLTVELGCLQDINQSLHDELASSITENKRLREELRCVKKFSSYRAHYHSSKAVEESKKSEGKESFCAQDDGYDVKREAALAEMGDKDAVFAKALDYLTRIEKSYRGTDL